jgi:hypothetical protein
MVTGGKALRLRMRGAKPHRSSRCSGSLSIGTTSLLAKSPCIGRIFLITSHCSSSLIIASRPVPKSFRRHVMKEFGVTGERLDVWGSIRNKGRTFILGWFWGPSRARRAKQLPGAQSTKRRNRWQAALLKRYSFNPRSPKWGGRNTTRCSFQCCVQCPSHTFRNLWLRQKYKKIISNLLSDLHILYDVKWKHNRYWGTWNTPLDILKYAASHPQNAFLVLFTPLFRNCFSPAAHHYLSKTHDGTPQNFASRKVGTKLYMAINMYHMQILAL